uniref:Uncharacterized protein n=1 Tax=Rhizophora mucronata TaxID=61149 RepID=A0A2P2PCV9_RHIMU
MSASPLCLFFLPGGVTGI